MSPYLAEERAEQAARERLRHELKTVTGIRSTIDERYRSAMKALRQAGESDAEIARLAQTTRQNVAYILGPKGRATGGAANQD